MTNVPKYWRSLDQLENSPEFLEFMHREFPVAASEYPEGISRRRWLQIMGASFALASVAGCRWETEKIAPLVNRPEGYIPGKPTHFATSIEVAGAPRHLLVTCYEGRPIKIEGNPEHPASLGATDGFSQASTLTLYDPDRSHVVRRRLKSRAAASDWAKFEEYWGEQRVALDRNQGEGFAVLMRPSSSLAREAMLNRLAEAYPSARFYEYSPLGREQELAGAEMAFGSRLRAHYKLADAKVIATFDADILCDHPNAVRYARDFAGTRELDGSDAINAEMSRLYAVESQFSITGAAADHRAAVRSSDIPAKLVELRDAIQARLEGNVPPEPEGLTAYQAYQERHQHHDEEGEEESQDEGASPRITSELVLWCLADDLVANRGAGLVAVGAAQTPEAHALAHQINSLLGNIGRTVLFTEEPTSEVPRGTLGELAAAIDAGSVTSLLVLEGNPAYDAPADLDFAAKLKKVAESIRYGYYEDETSLVCQWHLPACHPLEAWGDTVSYEGLPSVAQPLIAPLTDSKSVLEVLGLLVGGEAQSPEQLVRDALAPAFAEGLNDDGWAQLLHDGFSQASLSTAAEPTLVEDFEVQPAAPDTELELVFCASQSTYDGSFANNGWLQETPDFMTKLTWDNAAIVSPHTARERLQVAQGELLRVSVGDRSLELPVFILPGQANNSIGVALGYGRTAAGRVGGSTVSHARVVRGEREASEVVGFNSYHLRTTAAMHAVAGIEAQPTGKQYQLATTQDHFAIDDIGLQITEWRVGGLVREGTLEEYREAPDFAAHRVHEVPSDDLWDQPDFRDYANAWGMSVDLNKCTGCNACMVACQAENNVPIVGKEQVAIGREMHWIRLDRYFVGDIQQFDDPDPESPQVANQMITCQQCETAPCEQVCPVAATTHSEEGLNDMAYNRCVGTRYCANNCPYKVRRFNYFHDTGYIEKPENQLLQLVMNPEVTVRSRGVMEKCTYCVQRIAAARTEVRITGEPIVDGTVQTACQQACATRAIEFGDLNDPESRVSKAHADTRAYALLSELKTKPRMRYLARVRNPHPRLSPPIPAGHGGHGHSEEHHGDPVDSPQAMSPPPVLYDLDTSKI